jgi:hypothetical protein
MLMACPSLSQPPRRPRENVFISPAGKPFRAPPGQPYPVAVWFAEANTTHDGMLTHDQFRADFAAFFKVLDLNHDGVVDDQEINNYEQVIAPEVLPRLAQNLSPDGQDQAPGQTQGQNPGGGYPGGRGGRGGGRGGQGRGDQGAGAQAPARRAAPQIDGAPQYSLKNISEPVSGADLNFDGKVTLDEYLAAADRRFTALDTDRQGYLTLSGLPRTPEQIAIEGRRRLQP